MWMHKVDAITLEKRCGGMNEIWLWISKEVVDVMIGLVGLLIVLAWFVAAYLIGEFKRKKQAKKKGGAE